MFDSTKMNEFHDIKGRPVRARRLAEPESVDTLVGMTTARSGDWQVETTEGTLVIENDEFQELYALIDPGGTQKTDVIQKNGSAGQ
jgi:hypothetical protein